MHGYEKDWGHPQKGEQQEVHLYWVYTQPMSCKRAY